MRKEVAGAIERLNEIFGSGIFAECSRLKGGLSDVLSEMQLTTTESEQLKHMFDVLFCKADIFSLLKTELANGDTMCIQRVKEKLGATYFLPPDIALSAINSTLDVLGYSEYRQNAHDAIFASLTDEDFLTLSSDELFAKIDAWSNINEIAALVKEGHPIAQTVIGIICLRAEKYEEAAHLLENSAQMGNALAQFYLAKMFRNGEGVVQDYKKAFDWYYKAAKQGHVLAQFYTGTMYLNGNGVTKNDEQAVFWFNKAAEEGDPDAQCSLGLIYEKIDLDATPNIPQDYKKAFHWYLKSAEQGNHISQLQLGELFQNGKGVEHDHEKARYWLRKAAEQGNERAQALLNLFDGLQSLQNLLSK